MGCDPAGAGRGAVSSADPRVGGRRVVDAVTAAEEDFARAWLGACGPADPEPAEGYRRWREVVIGGRDRSCLTGSVLWLVLGGRVEAVLCNPPVVRLPMLARAAGGRSEEALLERLAMLPVELGGLVVADETFRVEGLMGSRLGEEGLFLSVFDRGSGSRVLFLSVEIGPSRVLVSAGLRRERVRGGTFDMFSQRWIPGGILLRCCCSDTER